MDNLPMDQSVSATDKQVDPVPTDLPDDTKFLGDKFDTIDATLRHILNLLAGTAKPPAQILLDVPAAGTTTAPFQSHVRYHIEQIVVPDNISNAIDLVVGTAVLLANLNRSGADIPCSFDVEPGVDITIRSQGGGQISAGHVTFILLGRVLESGT